MDRGLIAFIKKVKKCHLINDEHGDNSDRRDHESIRYGDKLTYIY